MTLKLIAVILVLSVKIITVNGQGGHGGGGHGGGGHHRPSKKIKRKSVCHTALKKLFYLQVIMVVAQHAPLMIAWILFL